MRRLALWAAAVAVVSAGVTGFSQAAAVADPVPTYVDLSISVGTIHFNSSYTAQTTIVLQTPGRLKPSGDVKLTISMFNPTAVKVKGRPCTKVAGSSTNFECTLLNSDLPSGVAFKIIPVDVQSSFLPIKPSSERWTATLNITDGDLTNNSASAAVTRP